MTPAEAKQLSRDLRALLKKVAPNDACRGDHLNSTLCRELIDLAATVQAGLDAAGLNSFFRAREENHGSEFPAYLPATSLGVSGGIVFLERLYPAWRASVNEVLAEVERGAP